MKDVRQAYKNYLLTVLLAILAFNLLDRWALGLVLQNIKSDLHLSDLQLGFLSGIAFALFYSVMGIPIARWADRGNRVAIISITAALWSVAVASCGLAASFMQLLVIRAGVAVGEAGGFVPGLSLLVDYFSRTERPRAVAIYSLGGPLSIVVGYWLAGWLNELYGWRVMFILIGAPGLALALLARLTLGEPRDARSATDTGSLHAESSRPELGLKEVAKRLYANATYRHLLFFLSAMFFFTYGILQWQPTFFIRSYAMKSGQIGSWFALIYGCGGILGTYLGGMWASRYAARNERLQLRAVAMTMIACAFLSCCIYVTRSRALAFTMMGCVMFAQVAINGPMFATIQTLVPERMRAVSVAVVLFFANLIGMGLGPLAAGALSDAFRPWAGEESLRYALLTLSPGYVWAAWHAWRASQTVAADLEAAELELESDAALADVSPQAAV